MNTVFLLLLAIALFPAPSLACIFQSQNVSGKSPFWPSRTIPVCFLPPKPSTNTSAPNPLDDEYKKQFNDNVATIKKTLQSQINNRSVFQMSGFDICPTPDSGHKIRFDLNQAGGGDGAMALSIGAGGGTESPNVTITTVNSEWLGGAKPQKSAKNPGAAPQATRVRAFQSAEHISWIALHETMHMLGLHHIEDWDAALTVGDLDVAAVIQVGNGPDTESIMNRSVRNLKDGIAQLSARDVSCLNAIANKTILSFPSRPAGQSPPKHDVQESTSPSGPIR